MFFSRSKFLRQAFGTLETGNWLFLKLLVASPKNARLFPGVVLRSYVALGGKCAWKAGDIREIVNVPEGTRISLEHMAGAGISTPIDELAYLALIASSTEPKCIFEIGTFRGRTALNFALNSPSDCVVWTMDLPPTPKNASGAAILEADKHLVESAQPGIDYLGKDVSGKIRQLFADSQTFDFSPYDNTVDIVFVDGVHHYDAVVSDTNNALRIVRSGGLIIWHDFANYGDYNDVTRAILEMLPAEEVLQISNTQLAVYRVPSKGPKNPRDREGK